MDPARGRKGRVKERDRAVDVCLEALAAAEVAGCGDWPRDNIRAELLGFDAHTLARLVDGSHRHARRRPRR